MERVSWNELAARSPHEQNDPPAKREQRSLKDVSL
jgi:hypothetical protein